jgi:hypothetical protein
MVLQHTSSQRSTPSGEERAHSLRRPAQRRERRGALLGVARGLGQAAAALVVRDRLRRATARASAARRRRRGAGCGCGASLSCTLWAGSGLVGSGLEIGIFCDSPHSGLLLSAILGLDF